MKKKRSVIYIVLAALLLPLDMRAQGELEYKVESQVTIGSGDHSPLWLNANKYGLSSVDKSNGYLRAALQRQLA